MTALAGLRQGWKWLSPHLNVAKTEASGLILWPNYFKSKLVLKSKIAFWRRQPFSTSSLPWQPLGPSAALLLWLLEHWRRLTRIEAFQDLWRLLRGLLVLLGFGLLLVSIGLVIWYFRLVQVV